MLISEGLQYHLDNNLSLCDSIYREGSQGFLDLICEARALYNEGHISLFEEDLDLINCPFRYSILKCFPFAPVLKASS